MNIVVCIKQVPDSAQIRVHPVTSTIMRQGVPTIINPYDLFALEEALRLRDRYGGNVTVLTMGPPMAKQALEKALAYGADQAVLLSDRHFAGSDTLATSFAISRAITKIGRGRAPEIVLTGKQTIDGDTAQVGPGIARRLELQQLTYVTKIFSVDFHARQIMVERRSEGGTQMLKSRLPCLISVLEGVNAIRRGSVADALRAARMQIPTWRAVDAGIEEIANCGLRGSPTVVKRVFAPTPRAEKAIQIEAIESGRVADEVIASIFEHQPALEASFQLNGFT
ncbi:electron transfer flavoprotein subunit beta/FixA family protein (plasmid) [Rhizobium leguminosarum]|uniref:Protein FixA n=2 Tax=Rhizobium leguminosarum TaxID=384 RepID=A1Z1W2_RHILT|nr:electron transfer flavoprotein subunit beta/FixA family protein [Rhizobium leguminosarum]ABM47383.1 electron transfer flavoprotein beta chain [Rhizobium leguminosarum bv. trifolii]UIK01391.1 electron transfer flavoprotein subunit beta/FixA family protein [Rhizobium leguminosarum]UIK14296.1 electron transfer flavoprotein subunit beta/FixA family protein [Rhizobium leguminosarum]WFT90730.1 electron transfer flavoprotein subunit beta/FixA family protein [Rhizobium leguminosarum]